MHHFILRLILSTIGVGTQVHHIHNSSIDFAELATIRITCLLSAGRIITYAGELENVIEDSTQQYQIKKLANINIKKISEWAKGSSNLFSVE